MSNETKRDVFDDAAFNIETSSPDGPKFADELRQRYAAALPDDLPVIPKAVSDYISKAKKPRQWGLLDVFWHLGDHISAMGFNGLYDWERWTVDNQDAVSRAWLLGVWRVEETGEIVKLEAEK
ncbi:hypothetical protein [Lacticaseibacillus nasuensis]|uniref:hypothetical protein n=1 Tax=Lacticaseibacillus nasuensis TaxID=944671 RepID=UPI0006D13EAA|nr:hypothetical protein [Lacticaseibacillus nasuensis]